MTRCLVIDIETKVDRMALAASGRRTAPRDMPAPLQVLTAVGIVGAQDKAGNSRHPIERSQHFIESQKRRGLFYEPPTLLPLLSEWYWILAGDLVLSGTCPQPRRADERPPYQKHAVAVTKRSQPVA